MDAKKKAGFGRKRAAPPKAGRSSEVKPMMPKPRATAKPKAKPPMVKAATIAPPPGQLRRQNAPGQRKRAMGLGNASTIAPGGQKRLGGGVRRGGPSSIGSLPTRGGLGQPLPPRPLGNPTVGGRAVIGTRPRPQPIAIGDPAGAFQQVSSGSGSTPRRRSGSRGTDL